MKKAGLLTTGFLTTALIFARADRSQAQDNLVAFNNNANPKTVSKTSVMRNGHAGDARQFSNKEKALVVYISGGEYNEKYTAQQYADMLSKMFKDPARTDYPTDVIFFVEESGDDRSTAVTMYSNGMPIDFNGGEYREEDLYTHPYKLVALIGTITKDHARTNGIASINEASNNNVMVATVE